jgi:hypothetical protein
MPGVKKSHVLTKRERIFLADAAKAIDAHVRSARYRNLPPERAFIHWFVEARYGASKNAYVSDGAGDGGIDAVIKYGERWIVLQSKYELTPSLSPIAKKPIDDLAVLAQLFRFGDKSELAAWLENVHTPHRRRYRTVADAASKDPAAVEFVLISNRLGIGRSNSKVLAEGIEKIGELWRLYELGLSPPAEELTIEWQQSPLLAMEGGMRSWVGFVELGDFLRAMKHDPAERLFAENVRTHLRSTVNQQITKTYESEPERFWLGNNGIYVVCRHSRQDGLRHHLNYASIINGSQTLHSIEQASWHPQSCKVLVRLLEIDGQKDPDLLNAIIKRTNSQNAMKLVNLFAHDAPQVNIARYLQRFRIFYERREREWQNEKKGTHDGWLAVSTLNAVQWLTVTQDGAAVGLARTQPAKLFDEERYEKVMRKRFSRDLERNDYRELAISIWCGSVASRLPKLLRRAGKPGDLQRAAKIATLFVTRTLFLAVNRSTALQHAVLNELLPNHRVGRTLPASVVQRLSKLLRDIVSLQEATQRKNEKLDLSNFFKRKETTQLAEKKLLSATNLKELGEGLQRGLTRIT